jgi:hypothetical protein
MKIALCFRFAQTLLNLAMLDFEGQFLVNTNMNLNKSKNMTSLRSEAPFSLRSVSRHRFSPNQAITSI